MWECAGGVPWDMSMYLPETSGEEVGFIVPPYVAMADISKYPDLVLEEGWDGYNFAHQDLETSPKLEEYWAVCWAGSLTNHAGFNSFDEMYGDEDEGIERQGEEGVDFVSEYGLEVSSEQPFGFAGEISEMENYDTYACRVEFTNSEGLNVMGGDRGEAITPREIHKDGEILEGFTEEYEGWEESYEEGELQDFVN